MITNVSTRITRLSVLAAAALVAGSAFAVPPVNVKSEHFVTAKEKNAVKAFRMKDGAMHCAIHTHNLQIRDPSRECFRSHCCQQNRAGGFSVRQPGDAR